MDVFRTILTIVGSFLVGHNLFGLEVNESVWQEILGGAMAVAGVVLAVIDKSVTLEMLQAGVRHLFLIVFMFLVAKGFINPAQLELYLGLVGTLGTLIYQWTSRKKTENLAAGTIEVTQLKGARPQDISAAA